MRRHPSDRPQPPLRALVLDHVTVVVPVGYALSSRDAVRLGRLVAQIRRARPANERE